jgi:hypothetical protein
MPNPYNDVELTEDDKQGIFEPVEAEKPIEAEAPATPQTHEAESLEGASDVSESDDSADMSDFNLEDYEVEIDGETFDGADILKWREDSSNRESWQASNTQKAQDIAKWSKLSEKLTSDSEFREYLKDYFYDDDDGLKSIGLDGELTPIETQEEEPQAEEAPIDSRIEERLENIELERVVDDLENELEAIIDNNPNLFKEDQDELDFLEFVEDNQMVDLEDAFKVWAYDSMKSELDHHRKLDGNRQRNQGKVVHKSEVGATEVSTPKQYKNVKDISIKDPDIAKYFNR